MKHSCSLLALLLTAAAGTHAQRPGSAEPVEVRAMRDEMQRSMKELHLDANQRPYYVAYKITDNARQEAQASFGALTSSFESRNRSLSVTVRVGDYNFDSGNYSGDGGLSALLGSLSTGAVSLPLDDNYDELRRKIWLATDTAYKKAVESYSAKLAKRESTDKSESLPDFSKAPARQESEVLPPVNGKLADAEHLVRAASAVFRSLPAVESSTAEFEIVNTTEYFLNSEGTAYTRSVPEVAFTANAATRSLTGETFRDSYSAFGHTAGALPPEAALLKEVEAVSARLAARRKGHVAKRYNGPVLVEGQAAAELFSRHFANLLVAHPHTSASGSNSILALLAGPTASLMNKVGTRVLPDFLSVSDSPQTKQAEGQPLSGDYKFDEEGTPAQTTLLVKDGVLKTLLTSRTPARGMLQSTGNQRERGVLPSNLFVDSSKGSSQAELKQQLIDLIKSRNLEFGVILKRLSGNAATECTRVYADGHEELLRDARVGEINAASFKDVLAVSKARTVLTERAGVLSLASFSPSSPDDLMSYVVPDLLFEDMSLEHAANDSPKLPVTPSPLAAN